MEESIKIICLLLSIIILSTIITIPLPITVHAQPLQKIRFGFLPNPDLFPCWIGQEMGWLKEVGIELELIPFKTGPEIISAMVAKECDMGMFGNAPIIFSNNEGIRVPVILITNEAAGVFAIFVRPESPYHELPDLKGATGSIIMGTNGEMFFRMALTHYGLKIEDFNLVHMSSADAAAALLAGKVDFAQVWDPQTAILLKKGMRPILFGNQLWNWSPPACYFHITTLIAIEPTFAEKNRDLVVRYLEVLFRGMKLWEEDPHTVADVSIRFLKKYGVELTMEDFMEPFVAHRYEYFTTLEKVLEWFGGPDKPVKGSPLYEVFRAQSDFWADQGKIPRPFVDPEVYLDKSFLIDLYNIKETSERNIKDAEKSVTDARASGADVSKAEELLKEAKTAYDNRDYSKAIHLAGMAKSSAMAELEKAITLRNYLIIGIIVACIIIGVGVYILRKRKVKK
jgi:ABC-type nitrate/sulfonate/bicarbonate transport system substrate-binding protein